MEALFHLLVPASIALAAGFDRKKVLMLAPLAILPDLDHAIAYRAMMHNIFFLLLVVTAIYAVKWDWEPAFLAALFIGSHLLFDIGGGIALLYPLDEGYYSFQSQIVGKAGSAPRLHLSFSRSTRAEWMSVLYGRLSRTERVWASTEMLVAVLLAATAIAFGKGVSTHNPESRSHRALGHHPPGPKKQVNIK